MKKVFTVIAVIALAGCSSGGSETEYTPQTPTINWESYPSSLKQTIDSAETAGDCIGLQSIFDTYINAGATDVAGYVDESLSSAGCYN